MGDPDLKKSKVSMIDVKSKSNRSTIGFGKSMSRLRVRRQSYGFGGVPGIRPVERTSQIAIEFKRPPLQFFPTYQLDSLYHFRPPAVEKIVNDALDENFTFHKYNVQESPSLAMRLSGEIMRKVKALAFNRYRIISVVTIGQKRAQSYNNAISFLWDHERDRYVNVQREVNSAFIQITVFGVYLD
ncbi:dynein light chain Tctex-type protein 2B [Leptidea sinapis]|uniref:dynein light chain Tctex-type protein 2B n=1 Tax=Leptidea sinapis TaxID=189913 RepID=UPI0021279E07|nr:dynein light chain Tctex-type protein 2B [Leptidea sinapis]